MPVYALLQLRCCLLRSCTVSTFAPAALIGDFGAGGAGEVVEEGGLEATPEPGHSVLDWCQIGRRRRDRWDSQLEMVEHCRQALTSVVDVARIDGPSMLARRVLCT